MIDDDAYYDLKNQLQEAMEENAMLKVKINAMIEDAIRIWNGLTWREFVTKYPKEEI
jgi:hypothetical protein